jgi:hypothetical protein
MAAAGLGTDSSTQLSSSCICHKHITIATLRVLPVILLLLLLTV